MKKIDTKTRNLLKMHNMLHPKVDVERLYIPRKDGERGLIDVKTAFKTVTIGLDHYLKHKEGQYPKKVLEHEQSTTKNSISKNATNKFKREVTMPEIESREDNSASENGTALKHMFKSKMKSMKEEKWKNNSCMASIHGS